MTSLVAALFGPRGMLLWFLITGPNTRCVRGTHRVTFSYHVSLRLEFLELFHGPAAADRVAPGRACWFPIRRSEGGNRRIVTIRVQRGEARANERQLSTPGFQRATARSMTETSGSDPWNISNLNMHMMDRTIGLYNIYAMSKDPFHDNTCVLSVIFNRFGQTRFNQQAVFLEAH